MFGFGKKKKAPASNGEKDRQISAPSSALKNSLLSLEQRLMFDAAAAATASEVATEQVAQEQAEAAVSGDAAHEAAGGEQGGGEDVVQALATYMPSEGYLELCVDDATVVNDQGMVEGQVDVAEPDLALVDHEQMNWAGILGNDHFAEGSFIETLGTEVGGSAYASDGVTGDSSEGVAVSNAGDPVNQGPTGSSQGEVGGEDGGGEEDLPAVTTAVPSERSVEVAFVDPTVPNYQELLANMDPNIEVILLDGARDGVEQMASALAGRTGIDAIHIISHGDVGTLQLGTGILNADTMAGQYADEFAMIKQALSEQADLLVYGCDFAEGDVGQAAVDQLAALTGADVAASDDLTGDTDLGGDWVLERQIGTVETTPLVFDMYRGVLSLEHTGEWAVTGTTANSTSSASASTTVGGVRTTVSFSNFSNATTSVSNFETTGTDATLNNIGAFSNTVQNTASVGMQFNWDTTPESATSLAATDAGTARMTISFSQAVKDPVIHLDRIGGAGGIQNGMQLTLLDDGASLTRLTGTNHFRVSGNVIDNSQAGVANSVGWGFGRESSTDTTAGTSAGSVRINGTVTSVTFLMAVSANTNVTEGLGGDSFELKLSFDAPPDAKDDTFTVNEDATLNGNLFASNGAGADHDSTGDAFTVTKINGAPFTVGSPITLATGTLTVTNAATGDFTFVPNANYNGPASFTYTIADANGGTDNATVNITVNAVNDAPTDITLSGSTVAENASTGTVVGTAAGVDPDASDTKTYSLTDTAGGRFAINSTTGVITVADGSGLNYEGATSHSITVRVTDTGGQSYDKTFTIGVTNVNEGPTDITLSGSTVAENASTGTVVGTAAGVDPDASDTKTYSLSDSAGGRFAINSTTGVITVADGSGLNYEGATSHSITVRVTDAGGQSYDKTFTIGMTNVNEGPTDITLSGSTVAENASTGTVVGTAAGVDPDASDTKTYSLTDTAGGRFAINSTTGVITVADGSGLNYEGATSHSLTVRVTDAGGQHYDKTFSIGVTNVNEGPTDITLTGSTVVENASTGTVVGTAAGVDPDASDTKTYSLTDTAGGRFAINSTTGVITVADGSGLNYEGATSHSITVRVTDAGGQSYDKTFTIGVTNVNEGPTDITLSGSTVAENASTGTVVGTAAGVDPDASDTKTYSLTDTAGGRFAINASTGVITVADGSGLNYEGATSHSITVRVTDAAGQSYDKTFTIGVTNVNEGPTKIQASMSDEQTVIPALLSNARIPSETGTPHASSLNILSDASKSETRDSPENIQQSMDWRSQSTPSGDTLSPERNRSDYAFGGETDDMVGSRSDGSLSTSLHMQDGTRTDLDTPQATSDGLGQVLRPPTDETEQIPDDSGDLAMPTLAGLMVAALQGSMKRKEKLTTMHDSIPPGEQQSADEQTSQESSPGDKRAPPRAA